MNKSEVIGALEQQAVVTYLAEMDSIRTMMEEMDLAEALKAYEMRLFLEAGDKEKHPELTNDKKRAGWVAEQMAEGQGAATREAHRIAVQAKLEAQATYGRRRRYGQHLVAIASLLGD